MSKYYTALFLIIAIFLASCDEVNFKQPQPAGIESLKTFPEKLQGHYVSTDHDTLFVDATELSIYNRNNPCDKLSEHDSLSNLVRLNKSGDYYFLNIQEHDLWSVLLIDFKTDDTVIVSMISLEDESLLSSLETITKITKEVYDNSDEIRYIIDPTHEELVQIIDNKLFIPISTFRKISKP